MFGVFIVNLEKLQPTVFIVCLYKINRLLWLIILHLFDKQTVPKYTYLFHFHIGSNIGWFLQVVARLYAQLLFVIIVVIYNFSATFIHTAMVLIQNQHGFGVWWTRFWCEMKTVLVKKMNTVSLWNKQCFGIKWIRFWYKEATVLV